MCDSQSQPQRNTRGQQVYLESCGALCEDEKSHILSKRGTVITGEMQEQIGTYRSSDTKLVPSNPQIPLSEKWDVRHEQDGDAKEACKALTNLLNGPSSFTC